MSIFISYARTFDKAYDTSFVEARILDIFDDMTNSKFIYNSIRATYSRFALVGKLLCYYPYLLSLLKYFKGHPTRICLG